MSTSPNNAQTAEMVKALYNSTILELNLSDTPDRAETLIDGAQEAAIELIVMAGFDAQDSDHFGAEMSDIVQTLLTIVMVRCPQMADRINKYDEVTIEAINQGPSS